jgi:hypothetical protein
VSIGFSLSRPGLVGIIDGCGEYVNETLFLSGTPPRFMVSAVHGSIGMTIVTF